MEKRRIVEILINNMSTPKKVIFSSSIKLNKFLNKIFVGCNEVFNNSCDEYMCAVNTNDVVAVWCSNEELSCKGNNSNVFKIHVGLHDNIGFEFYVIGENRAKSCFRIFSDCIAVSPNNEAYEINQDENKKCVFVFTKGVKYVSVDPFDLKLNNNNNNNNKVINGYC